MPALKQLGNKNSVYRDGDGDGKSEEKGKYTSGYYGINFHTADRNYKANLVKAKINGWSAGCQVCNNTKEYREILAIIKKSKQKYVSYALLKEFSV
jgi:hypothetical protein